MPLQVLIKHQNSSENENPKYVGYLALLKLKHCVTYITFRKLLILAIFDNTI